MKIKLNTRINKKNGSILLILVLGMIAIAGIIPFLYESTNNSSKIMLSYDEANKFNWAADSAAYEGFKKSYKESFGKGLGSSSTFLPKEDLNIIFNYINGSKAIGKITQYNSFFNKNVCTVAVGTGSNDINLESIPYSYIKPCVVSINESTFILDRNGTLFKYKKNSGWEQISKNLIRDKNNNDKIIKDEKYWQIASDKDGNPVALTTTLEACPLLWKTYKGKTIYIKGDVVKNVYSIGKAGSDLPKSTYNYIYLTKSDKPNELKINRDKKTICSVDANELADFSFGGNHGLFLKANIATDTSKGYKLFGWGDNSKKQLNNSGNTTFNSPIEIDNPANASSSSLFSSPSSAISGSEVSLLNHNETIADYFKRYYKYENVSSACDIVNPYNGGEIEHHNGPGESCTCALCLDIFNLHKQSDELKTYITITDAQIITSLTFLINKNKSLGNNYYTKCKLINESGGEDFEEIIVKNNIATQDVIPPLSNVAKLEFYPKNTYSEKMIGTGTYRIELEYSTDGKVSWTPFKNEDFFWGINPQEVDDASLTAYIENNYNNENEEVAPEYAFKQEDVYGQIFRFNDNIYNLRGGAVYDNDNDNDDDEDNDNDKLIYYAIAAGYQCSLAVVAKETDVPSESGVMPDNFYLIGWGDNSYNQLGLSSHSNIVPLSSDIIKKYRDMKCGKYHTLFLTKDGKVYSWGGKIAKATPHLVEGLKGKNIVSISANDKSASDENNICSSALDDEGNIYIWYDNNSNKNNESKPIIFKGGRDFSM